jgi:hypothetical protein
VPTAGGVASHLTQNGMVGTWESQNQFFGLSNRLKKRYNADGTAESWLASGAKAGLTTSVILPPRHLKSRWRVEGDTVVMWNYTENGVPSKEFGTYRDKITAMEPNYYEFYSHENVDQRPGRCYRTTKSITDPF